MYREVIYFLISPSHKVGVFKTIYGVKGGQFATLDGVLILLFINPLVFTVTPARTEETGPNKCSTIPSNHYLCSGEEDKNKNDKNDEEIRPTTSTPKCK